MKVIFSLLMILSLIFAVSCNEGKDKPESEETVERTLDENMDYHHEILPSIAGYIDSTAQSPLNRIVSSEMKSDNKSKFISVIYELKNGDIQALNLHFEGEYMKDRLSINHPFIVACECDDNCKDCGFKTTDEGVMCGCMAAGKDSPCNLKISNIKNYDFYKTFHDRGYKILSKIGF